jgi:hypothetical protein
MIFRGCDANPQFRDGHHGSLGKFVMAVTAVQAPRW